MLSGLLCGSLNRGKLAPDDWRGKIPVFSEPELIRTLQLVEALRPIVKRCHITMGHLAVAWVLRRPEMTSADVGARSVQQVEQNVMAADCIIAKQDVLEIDAVLENNDKMKKH